MIADRTTLYKECNTVLLLIVNGQDELAPVTMVNNSCGSQQLRGFTTVMVLSLY